jgi:hypothetical protein
MQGKSCVFGGCRSRPVAIDGLCAEHSHASLNGPVHRATLRQYVRHAKLYGGYDSVFEEACRDLTPTELGNLCIAMRPMSHEYRSGQKRCTEKFKLKPSWRDDLIGGLLEAGEKTATIADMAGCSKQHVLDVLQVLNHPSESPETLASNATTEEGRGIACPSCMRSLPAQNDPPYCPDLWHAESGWIEDGTLEESHVLPGDLVAA